MNLLDKHTAPPPRSGFRLVPFAYGFRPFFMGAGLFALLAVAGWLWIYSSALMPLQGLPSQLWHGHEMVFGFVGAAIGGFLLTAVPSWTGARGFGGAPLIAAFSAWLAGRIAFALAPWIPGWLLVVCELAYVPVLASLIAPPLFRQRNRNTPLLGVLVALWIADAVYLYGILSLQAALASRVLLVGIDIALVLMTVIGGRIVPAFTANALRSRGVTVEIRSLAWLETTVIAAMVVNVVVDAVAAPAAIIIAVAAVAAVAHAVRFSKWQSVRTLSQPLVWVLHLGYIWLPVGFAMKAIFFATGAVWTAHWLHALTIGAAATMIVAVMTRASLGHTGRPLAVGTPIALAYVLLGTAALVRTIAPALVPQHYVATVHAAGALWIAAFTLFVIVYAPILLGPRVDGRSG